MNSVMIEGYQEHIQDTYEKIEIIDVGVQEAQAVEKGKYSTV